MKNMNRNTSQEVVNIPDSAMKEMGAEKFYKAIDDRNKAERIENYGTYENPNWRYILASYENFCEYAESDLCMWSFNKRDEHRNVIPDTKKPTEDDYQMWKRMHLPEEDKKFPEYEKHLATFETFKEWIKSGENDYDLRDNNNPRMTDYLVLREHLLGIPITECDDPNDPMYYADFKDVYLYCSESRGQDRSNIFTKMTIKGVFSDICPSSERDESFDIEHYGLKPQPSKDHPLHSKWVEHFKKIAYHRPSAMYSNGYHATNARKKFLKTCTEEEIATASKMASKDIIGDSGLNDIYDFEKAFYVNLVLYKNYLKEN